MHPAAAGSNRLSLQSPITNSSAISIIQQPQQQHVVYPIAPLQPCNVNLYPACAYQDMQRNGVSLATEISTTQGKSYKWHSKNNAIRSQQSYCQQQQHSHHQLSCNPKPLIIFDQITNPVPTPLPTSSILVASSTFARGSFSSDQLSLPPSYFKPTDFQTFCMVPDQQSLKHQRQSMHSSYYNISTTNTCSLQTLKSPPKSSNISPFATVAGFGSSQIAESLKPTQSSQILSSGTFAQEEQIVTPSLDVASTGSRITSQSNMKGPKLVPSDHSEISIEWPSSSTDRSNNNIIKTHETATGNNNRINDIPVPATASDQEDQLSDDSSASFNFTIEAEKMVSALCNTTSSNELAKEETRNAKNYTTRFYCGAGDNAPTKSSWLTNFATEYKSCGKTASTQTDEPSRDFSQYPDLIRKTAFWGCSEAETVIRSRRTNDNKHTLLTHLLSATKMAITKSSTRFPVFPGNKNFANDLINSMLRISNAWLILDNYLNKEHYPSLEGKFDAELATNFHSWEESTYVILKKMIETFVKLERDDCSTDISSEMSCTIFPGEISLYTNYNLFESLRPGSDSNKIETTDQECTEEGVRKNFGYERTHVSPEKLKMWFCSEISNKNDQLGQKDMKLRSKWTVTEGVTSSTGSAKYVNNSKNTNVGTFSNGSYRSKSATMKFDIYKQSLSAELSNLTNKIRKREDSWPLSDKNRMLFFSDNVQPKYTSTELSFPIQQATSSHLHSVNPFTQKYIPRLDTFDSTLSVPLESIYVEQNAIPGMALNPTACLPCVQNDWNYDKRPNPNFTGHILDPAYVGRPSSDQTNATAIPKNKMTLLSQIEPITSMKKEACGMAANLSAWFASMKNTGARKIVPDSVFGRGDQRMCGQTQPDPTAYSQEMPRGAIGFVESFQMEANRRLQTLQSMHNPRNAPWQMLVQNTSKNQHDDYDSSEDVRVYMKPGSYNVPKKRHQKKGNRRAENFRSSCGSSRNSDNYHNSRYVKERTSYGTRDNNSAAPSTKNPLGQSAGVPRASVSLGGSPSILKRVDSTASNNQRDVTWKAACASAEMLLEALNVKEEIESGSERAKGTIEVDKKKTSGKDKSLLAQQRNEDKSMLDRCRTESPNEDEDDCVGPSSYEASEDDSETTFNAPRNASLTRKIQSQENRNGRTNVKTDFWLIRTLNNANIKNKPKCCKNDALEDSDSTADSSIVGDEKSSPQISYATISSTTITLARSGTPEKKELTNCSREQSTDDNVINKQKSIDAEVASKATYSETVRRNTNSNAGKLDKTKDSNISNNQSPASDRHCSDKDPEKNVQTLNPRGSSSKSSKFVEDASDRAEEKSDCKTRSARSEALKLAWNSKSVKIKSPVLLGFHSRKKNMSGNLNNKSNNKTGDRGWSVWYSSKRRQTLSPATLNKLEKIHQTIWQMDEAQIFKCPQSIDDNRSDNTTNRTTENYYNMKRPIFLETISYKLRNRSYQKVEHVIRDFRKIVQNSKLYYKLCNKQDDSNRAKDIETLSKRLEELFEEHFGDWDLENISSSPRDTAESSIDARSKNVEQNQDKTKKN